MVSIGLSFVFFSLVLIFAAINNLSDELRKLRKSYDEERNRNWDRYLGSKVVKRPVGIPRDPK